MQSDYRRFSAQGMEAGRDHGGLLHVLPKNIWLLCRADSQSVRAGEPLPAARRNAVQSGGGEGAGRLHSIAVQERGETFGDCPRTLREAGAIGAALEAGRLWDKGRVSTFIGLDAVGQPQLHDDPKRKPRACYFCKNECLRTFVDVQTNLVAEIQPAKKPSKVPLPPGSQRFIIATCEKGTVEDVGSMREIKSALDTEKKKHPNLADIAAHDVFRVPELPSVADSPPRFVLTTTQKTRAQKMQNRAKLRIGIPRVLNLYSTAPLFTGIFRNRWGSKPKASFSRNTPASSSTKMGCKRGSIDPCFPSKLGIPHRPRPADGGPHEEAAGR